MSLRLCTKCGLVHGGRRIVDCLGEIQQRVGAAKGAFGNDRDVNMADKLLPLLESSFTALVNLRSRKAP